MRSYKELIREIDYLKTCLSFDNYLYAVCICITNNTVNTLGCIKFMDGVDHWRSRDKMFANISGEKYWVLVDKSVYENFNKGKETFTVKGFK